MTPTGFLIIVVEAVSLGPGDGVSTVRGFRVYSPGFFLARLKTALETYTIHAVTSCGHTPGGGDRMCAVCRLASSVFPV